MEPTLANKDHILINKLIYHFYKPSRGDVIILKVSESQNFVKRIIALPGETIKIENYKIYIDSKELKESYLNEFTLGKFGPYTIPKGCVFVMGDNRIDSFDSRYPQLRDIKYENIIGKVVFKVFPFNKVKYMR